MTQQRDDFFQTPFEEKHRRGQNMLLPNSRKINTTAGASHVRKIVYTFARSCIGNITFARLLTRSSGSSSSMLSYCQKAGEMRFEHNDQTGRRAREHGLTSICAIFCNSSKIRLSMGLVRNIPMYWRYHNKCMSTTLKRHVPHHIESHAPRTLFRQSLANWPSLSMSIGSP